MTAEPRTGVGPVDRWVGHAFGLALRSDTEIAGWPGGSVPGDLPAVTIETVSDLESNPAEDDEPGEIILEHRSVDQRVRLQVRYAPSSGYAIRAPGVGCFRVSPLGDRIECAPDAGVPAWCWQRSLIGQALPLTSVLRGYEAFHASAVVVDGAAVALMGESGMGKSTIAAELLLQGGSFLTDDVVAVSAGGTEPPLAHPGPGLMSMRRVTMDRLGPAAVGCIGTPVGVSDEGGRLSIARWERAAPLARIYQLQQAPAGSDLRLERVESVVPAVIGTTFVGIVQTTDRLAHQLAVLASIYRSVPVTRALIPPDGNLADAAALVLADVGQPAAACER